MALDGIPATALTAYQAAEHRQRLVDATCGLSWPLLAGIGRVESDHGRFAGAVLPADGVSTPPIIGIPLDGHGTARILDTDHGRLDGDRVYDRAVGPMQFIPSTWAAFGVDGNRDGVTDPFNIFDAAAAAAHYLCAAGGNLMTLDGQMRAIRAYNDSDTYIALVLKLEGIYARGVPGLTVPILPPTSPLPSQRSTVPPANPGPPLATLSPPRPASGTTPTVAQTSAQPASSGPSPSTSSTAIPPSSAPACPTPTASSPSSTSPAGTPTQSTTLPTGSTSIGSPSTSSTATPSPTSPATPTPPSPTC